MCNLALLPQGRVQVVMNPCKYEIPSGSTYGYLIADDADQVREPKRVHIEATWAIMKSTVADRKQGQ